MIVSELNATVNVLRTLRFFAFPISSRLRNKKNRVGQCEEKTDAVSRPRVPGLYQA
jgi:hypothetical protein